MILFPNCKINLGLDILRRREDGYHDLETAMIPVCGLCDVLEILPRSGSGVDFTASGLTLDCRPEKNLCLRAWQLMADRYGIGGIRMHLHKVIPFGAGLGGGSADAAFALVGLDRMFGLELDTVTLEALAAELGSDTAFFVRNEPQMARGRGEMLEPLALPLAGIGIVIVKLPVSVSTAQAYAGVTPRQPKKPLAERLAVGMESWRATVTNAFEPSVFATHPELAALKERLYALGADYAAMSGSGSALFGLFGKSEAVQSGTARAAQVAERLKNEYSDAFVYSGSLA